jgi:hypothetical protein
MSIAPIQSKIDFLDLIENLSDYQVEEFSKVVQIKP